MIFFRSYKQGRLDYPRFDGTDFSGWLMKMEQYFETGQIREVDKVRVTMMNLEGRALQWSSISPQPPPPSLC